MASVDVKGAEFEPLLASESASEIASETASEIAGEKVE